MRACVCGREEARARARAPPQPSSRRRSLTQKSNRLRSPKKQPQEVVNLILEAQASGPAAIAELAPAGGGSGGGQGQVQGALLRLRLPPGGAVPVAELRAHKRAFVRLATRREHGRVEDPAAARRLFVEYLQRELDARLL